MASTSNPNDKIKYDYWDTEYGLTEVIETYTYLYDQHGNWTTKLTNRNNQLTSLEIRKLAYWD